MTDINEDNEELEVLQTVLSKIDKLEGEGKDSIFTSIYENQPLILSMMMQYEDHMDQGNLTEEAFNDINDLLFIIFLFFEHKTNISKAQVSQEAFQKKLELNLSFVNYLTEEDQATQIELSEADLNKMHFKNLYLSLTQIADDCSSFQKLEHDFKAAIFLEMKTLIECMEATLLDT